MNWWAIRNRQTADERAGEANGAGVEGIASTKYSPLDRIVTLLTLSSCAALARINYNGINAMIPIWFKRTISERSL